MSFVMFEEKIKGYLERYTGNESVVHVPDYVTYIGWRAFEENTTVTEIYLPDSVQKISDRAFRGCTALKKIRMPAHLEYIGELVFSDCTSLESIEIPQGVPQLGRYSFSRCRALKSVVLPEGLTKIWHEAFKDCSSLETIVVPTTLEWLGDDVFSRYSHVTDHDDHDWANGNVSSPVHTVIFPGRIEDFRFGSIGSTAALCRGFLSRPELYSAEIAEEYAAHILEHLDAVFGNTKDKDALARYVVSRAAQARG